MIRDSFNLSFDLYVHYFQQSSLSFNNMFSVALLIHHMKNVCGFVLLKVLEDDKGYPSSLFRRDDLHKSI